MGGVQLLICFSMVFAIQPSQVISSLDTRALGCQADETLVYGRTIHDKTKTCGDVISSLLDIYDARLVRECNRIMAYQKPIKHVKSAFIDTCKGEAQGVSYRAAACCPGTLTEARCFSCNTWNPEHCNLGRVQTCSSSQACMTRFDYIAAGKGVTKVRVIKGCVAAARCYAQQSENRERCKDNVVNPSCTRCCTSPLCNERTLYHRLNAYDKAVAADVCNKNNGKKNPCLNDGECTPTNLQDPKYTCKCPDGFHGKHCEQNACQPNRCGDNTCTPVKVAPYYQCYCSAGWFGQHCSEAYKMCRENICMNGGICYEQEAGQRCKCPDGYFGGQCEIKANTTCPGDAPYLRFDREFHALTRIGSCTSITSSVHRFFQRQTWQLRLCRHDQRDHGFTDGRDGDLSKMNARHVSLYQCSQGDNIIKYSFDMCCPACLTRPCANDGWCIQDGDSFMCKCRFGFAGDRCQHQTALCVISGDPHTTTFDRKHLTFQGTCKYNAASLPANNTAGLPPFSVFNKNERRDGNNAVAYLKYIEIHVYGHVIRLARSNVVTIDGKELLTGFDKVSLHGGKLTVQASGPAIRVETDFGLIVENDGYWVGMIELPTSVGGQVTGMCGDNNGDPDDDVRMCGGEDVSDKEAGFSLVGKSCQVDDPEDAKCTTAIEANPEKCTVKEFRHLNTAGYCGFITQRGFSPFAKCLTQHPELMTHAENCAFDVCANKNNLKDAKEAACGSLMALAEACKHRGFEVNWRARARCGMKCTAGAVYSFRGSACPATCTNPNAADTCSQKEREVCVCRRGLILLGDECVRPQTCGCVDENGKRVPVGTTWMASDCKSNRTCEYCKDCKEGYGRIVDVPNECASPSVCMNGKCEGRDKEDNDRQGMSAT